MSAIEASDTLVGLAQIASAFAGFAALVSVLKERGNRAETAHGILRLRVVISTSVVVVVACLVPIGLANFELSERVVWATSAAKSYQPVQGLFPPDRTDTDPPEHLPDPGFTAVPRSPHPEYLSGGIRILAFCSLGVRRR